MSYEPIEHLNDRGNLVRERTFFYRERTYYDHALLPKGWHTLGADQDAWYFGIWVNASIREVITFAEGDEFHVTCPTNESFRLELLDMATFYRGPFIAAAQSVLDQLPLQVAA